MSRPPRESPLYLRLPALALSLAIGGFLVFQAGVPGCGSSEDKSPQAEPTAPAPAMPAETTKHTAAPPTNKPTDKLADKLADKPTSAGDPLPLPTNANNSNKANKKTVEPPPKPRFFPASKAIAPLIEPEVLLPPKQAPKAQPAPQAQQAANAAPSGKH